jgi:hypothetical protein
MLGNLPRVTNKATFQPWNLAFDGTNESFPYERGAIDYHHQYDFTRNQQGLPSDLARNLTAPQYFQPMDLVSQYKNRVLPIPSMIVSAAMLNSVASWLLIASPIFLTSEMNFESNFREINQVEFTPIAQAGIGHEQSSTEMSWRSTTQKFTSSFPILRDYALDENFGSKEWRFQLSGLSSRAMLTIYKQVAYQIVQMAYENKVSNYMKQTPFDLSKLYEAETSTFLCAADHIDIFINEVRKYEDTIPGANMIVIPKGAAQWVKSVEGVSTTMTTKRFTTDPDTNELKVVLDDISGPKTVKTITIGNRDYQIVEMPNFKVNIQTDSYEQPLDTAVTTCQMYGPNPKITANVPTVHKPGVNDIYLYYQTKTSGQTLPVSYIDCLKACFLWDEKSGKPSEYTKQFVKELTDASYRPARNGTYLDDEDADNNSCDTVDIEDKTDLNSMTAFRDLPAPFVWDRNEQRVKNAKRVGDMHLRHLPNVWVKKFADAMMTEMNRCCRTITMEEMLEEYYSLMDDIKNTVPTPEYLNALRNANAKYSQNSEGKLQASKTPKKDYYPNASELNEWRGNEFGSLRLPQTGGTITDTYPWGFNSGPGLKTLAKEADNATSDWKEAGERAKRVVIFLEAIIRVIKSCIGNSDMVNKDYTLPWFHKDMEITTLVDHLGPYGIPVFMSMPNVDKGGSPSQQPKDFSKFQFISKEAKFISCLAKDNGSIDEILKTFLQQMIDVTASLSERKKIYDKLQDLVIATCGWNDTENKTQEIAFVTIITLDILSRVNKAIGDITRDDATKLITAKSAQELSEKLRDIDNDLNVFLTPSKKKMATSALDKLIKGNTTYSDLTIAKLENRKKKEFLREQEKIDVYGLGTTETFAGKQKELQKAERAYSRALASGTDEEVTKTEDDLRKLQKGFVMSPKTAGSAYVDNVKVGQRYLRAPLMASEALLDYLRTIPDDEAPLVLMADPNTLYETELTYYVSSNIKDYQTFKDRERDSPMNFTTQAFPNAFSFHSSTPSSDGDNDYSENRTSSYQQDKYGDDMDIFQSLKEPIKSSYAFGRDYSETDAGDVYSGYRGQAAKRVKPRSYFDEAPDTSASPHVIVDEDSLNAEYFGPWQQRFNYMETVMSDLVGSRLFFRAIILAPNIFSTFANPDKIGQKLINVMVFRPFIEQVVSSAIVLETGSSLTALGHTSVWVSKDERGIDHTRCDFNTGVVKVNPFNYGMIYGAFPKSFIGGMKIDFMKDPNDFTKANPEKPSCIAMPMPLGESVISYPAHPNNQSTYNRPDTAGDHLRKLSFARFFLSVFNQDTVLAVDGLHSDRTNYKRHVAVSFCGEKGACGYLDPTREEHKVEFVEGSGARGGLEMNVGKAYLTHNGKPIPFPIVNTEHYTC